MTKIEELHYIVELLQKHDLPLSPILEYAIKEREEQYFIEANGRAIVHEDEPVFDVYKELDDYVQEFANLSVGVVKGKKLPHKAILLLSIMNLIEDGTLSVNRLELDKTIVNSFASCWKKYFGDVKIPSIWIPFWYMKSESFWHFKPNGNEELLHGLLQFAGHPSVGQMRPVIKYAYLDKALFDYMENDGCREKLRETIINNWLYVDLSG